MTVWVIVPAAGIGSRFGGALPKQYQLVAGKLIIEHTLERLLGLAPTGMAVAIGASDSHWRTLAISEDPRIVTVAGGEERADSVRGALHALRSSLGDSDWVLVHDVARPCVDPEDIARLMARVADSPVGGILATPVSDTLKLSDGEDAIETTADRSRLWAAMTPQLFRYGVLLQAMEQCWRRGLNPTDEAMAVELMGLKPVLVEGRRDNIKITRREDIAVAEAIMRCQSGAGDAEERPR